jgi:hypothetical protein
MSVTVFEIVPHPLHRGHWLLKANERIPYGLWYGELRQAISYAQWAARDFENAEIRVYKAGRDSRGATGAERGLETGEARRLLLNGAHEL